MINVAIRPVTETYGEIIYIEPADGTSYLSWQEDTNLVVMTNVSDIYEESYAQLSDSTWIIKSKASVNIEFSQVESAGASTPEDNTNYTATVTCSDTTITSLIITFGTLDIDVSLTDGVGRIDLIRDSYGNLNVKVCSMPYLKSTGLNYVLHTGNVIDTCTVNVKDGSYHIISSSTSSNIEYIKTLLDSVTLVSAHDKRWMNQKEIIKWYGINYLMEHQSADVAEVKAYVEGVINTKYPNDPIVINFEGLMLSYALLGVEWHLIEEATFEALRTMIINTPLSDLGTILNTL